MSNIANRAITIFWCHLDIYRKIYGNRSKFYYIKKYLLITIIIQIYENNTF